MASPIRHSTASTRMHTSIQFRPEAWGGPCPPTEERVLIGPPQFHPLSGRPNPRAVSCGAPLETGAQSPSASGPGPSRQNARIVAPSSGGGQSPGATDLSWAPAPHPHPPASSSWPSPGARPTLASLLPAPARGAYERYVRSGPGRRPGTGDEGARASLLPRPLLTPPSPRLLPPPAGSW